MISYAIQHHPSRADLLYRTAELSPEIVTDPFIASPVRNPWGTYRTALERTPECSHRVIIQDDAELCGGFSNALEQAVSACPSSILCLFVPTTLRHGSKLLMEACSRNESFSPLSSREWVPVVALCWPYEIIPEFLEWADQRGYSLTKHRADDAIVGEFVRERNHVVYATVPSLVEHPDDVSSTIGTKTGNPRRATCFAGESAYLIEWS